MKCNHQKDGHGFYTKIIESYRQYYAPDGTATGTDDGLGGSSRGGTIAYCDNCERRLGRVNIDRFTGKAKVGSSHEAISDRRES
jgi:hypothetical protein